MASVGTLTIDLRAETATITKAFKSLTKLSFDTAKDIERSFKIVGGVVVAAGAAIATSLAVAVKNAANTAEAFNSLSQRVGVSVETISAFAHAAELSETSIDALAKGMGFLSKNMVAAAEGNKEAIKLFRDLGVSFEDANGKLRPVEDVLLDIAQRFSGLEDGAGKSTLAMRAMGKGAQELIPFLDQGKTGLKAMTDEARELGKVISGETARAADQFNDNLSRLDGIAQGFARTLLAKLAPSLEAVTNRLVEMGKESNPSGGVAQFVADFLRSTASLAVVAAAHVAELSNQMRLLFTIIRLAAANAPLSDVTEAFRQAARDADQISIDMADSLSAIWDTTRKQIKLTATEIRGIFLEIGKAPNLDASHGRGPAGITPDIKTLSDSAKLAAAEMEGLKNGTLRLLDAFSKTDAASMMELAIRKIASVADTAKKALMDLLKTQREAIDNAQVQALLGAGPIAALPGFGGPFSDSKVLKDIFDASTAAIKRTADEMKKAIDKTIEFNRRVQELGQRLGQTFRDAILHGRSFHDVLGILIQDIAAFLFELLKKSSSFLSGGGFGGFLGSLLSGIFGGGRQHGGPVKSGQTFLVGEEGPELFTPNTSGSIIPNSRLAGSPQVIFQIDARGADAGAEQKVRRGLEAVHKQAVRDAVRVIEERRLRRP